jgi:hypothetical protein
VLDLAPTPEPGRNKVSSSAEMLRAMSGDEEKMFFPKKAGELKNSNKYS